MDKRWIGILLILIAGLTCMYIIVDNSNTVGDAITVISDVTVPVPTGFKISETNSVEARLLNENNNATIILTCIDDDLNAFKEFSNVLSEFEEEHDVTLVKNVTNSTFAEIEFNDVNSGANTTFTLFEKENHSFIMKLENFPDEDQKENDMMHIIENMIHDYKQNK